jgi:MFS family permease
VTASASPDALPEFRQLTDASLRECVDHRAFPDFRPPVYCVVQAAFMLCSQEEGAMPSSDAIVSSVTAMANEWRMVAVAWHVVLALAVTAFLGGWRPSNRVASYLLAAPLLSVSAAAWAWGNPFNGGVFAALFVLLSVLSRRVSAEAVHVGGPAVVVPGLALVVFGWVYPHFLETSRWTTYMYAAPLGLLPCPTLAAVIGATLVLGVLGSREWSLVVAAAGLVYGVVGVSVLGVALDYLLVAGALALGVATATITQRARLVHAVTGPTP